MFAAMDVGAPFVLFPVHFGYHGAGKFEDKLSACFDLFDFDSSASLTLEELRICIRTSLSGLCKLLGQEEPPPGEVDDLSARAFAALGGGGSSIGREEFLRWVVATPTIIGTVCRFGTVNGEQTRRRYAQRMAEDKAAQKIQRAFLSMQARAASGAGVASSAGSTASARVDSLRHRDDPALGSAFDPSVHAAALKRAKAVFDSIDSDGSGSISTRELIASMDAPASAAAAASSTAAAASAAQSASAREYLPATLSAFRAMDCDGDGHLTFPEMLRVLYPAARGRDVAAMARSVTGPDPPVDKEVVQALLIWFNKGAGKAGAAAGDGANARSAAPGTGTAAATAGTMTMTLRDAVAGLRSDALFRPLVEHYTPPSRLLDTPLSFTQLLQELCGGEGPRVRERLARVMEWARAAQLLQQHALPPHLDEKRQRELETLFNLYDQDANGCIDMNGERTAPPLDARATRPLQRFCSSRLHGSAHRCFSLFDSSLSVSMRVLCDRRAAQPFRWSGLQC